MRGKINLHRYNLIDYCFLFALLWSSFLFFNYKTVFGGDPEIHIIFAKNFLNGHWLEFNKGFKTGGETSPIYLLIVSLFLLIFEEFTQYAMQVLGLLSVAGSAIILYVGNTYPQKKPRAYFSVLFCSMAFVPFQAWQGMENFLFAFLTLLFIHLILVKRITGEITLPFVASFLFFLRPEGILIPAWFLWVSLHHRNIRLVISSFLSIIIIYILYIFINHYIGGEMIHAGTIKAITSKSNSVKLSLANLEVFISQKPIIGYLYCSPIILLFVFYIRNLNFEDKSLLIIFGLVPFFAHLFNILPNTHFSRYVLYSYTLVFYIFGKKIFPKLMPFQIAFLSLWIFSISIIEFKARSDLEKFEVSQSAFELTDEYIKNNSDRMYAKLYQGVLPITIALQEVQLRGRLDDRFLIWSLDGITDSNLSNFVNHSSINHFDYIKSRRIQYLIGLPNYNVDRNQASLADYAFVNGESQCIRGIYLKVTTLPETYQVNSC